MNVLYSGFRDPSHSINGGYDKITAIRLTKKILLSENYLFGKCKFKTHIMRIPVTFLDIHTRILRRRYDITHLFYGEITMIFFLPYFKSKKHKTVITVHLDVEKRRYPKLFIWLLRFFDGIIVLSSQQKNYLENKYNIKSTFIPHGFSTPQFTICMPRDVEGNLMSKDKINIITVGENYRDFATLKYVVNKLENNGKYQFHLVGIPDFIKGELSRCANVSIYPRLSDNEYYSLISKADYGFLPLLFATANNTLLEYQYLNLPSILPDIDGVSDYAAPEPLNYFYSDKEHLINIILSLNKSDKTEELSSFAQKHFDWDKIYEKLIVFYDSLIHRDQNGDCRN